MRRYELMLILRPDTPDDRVQQVLDRVTRGIAADDGQIVKVSPWGKRRLAYPIDTFREGSYFIVVFDAPSEAVAELERSINITEEIMRHLVTRVERSSSSRRSGRVDESAEAGGIDDEPEIVVPPIDEDEEPDGEFIDESETEAAPKAIE